MSLKIIIIIMIIIGLIYNYFNHKEFFSCTDCEKCYDETINIQQAFNAPQLPIIIESPSTLKASSYMSKIPVYSSILSIF